MVAAAVRFHPAAAQEAESTYDWYAARNPAAAHGFREELRQPSTLLVRTLAPGRAIVTALADMCSRDTPSVWCTSFAAMTSRLSPWPTDGGDLATGGRDSDMPSNLRMQRSALRAAADPAR